MFVHLKKLLQDVACLSRDDTHTDGEMEIKYKCHLVNVCRRGGKEDRDGFTSGSMVCSEWLRSGRGGDWTSPEVHTAGHLVVLTAVGTVIHGNTT